MSTKLLLNESPLVVQPSLAVLLGLNEALVLQQIHYWLNPKFNKNYEEGRHWVHKTYRQWTMELPFFSEKTMRRVITNLERQGLLLSRSLARRFNRTKSYTIDYEVLEDLSQGRAHPQNDQHHATGQNDHIDLPAKRDYTRDQREEKGAQEACLNTQDQGSEGTATEGLGAGGHEEAIDLRPHGQKGRGAGGQNDQMDVVRLTRSYKEEKITKKITFPPPPSSSTALAKRHEEEEEEEKLKEVKNLRSEDQTLDMQPSGSERVPHHAPLSSVSVQEETVQERIPQEKTHQEKSPQAITPQDQAHQALSDPTLPARALKIWNEVVQSARGDRDVYLSPKRQRTLSQVLPHFFKQDLNAFRAMCVHLADLLSFHLKLVHQL